MFGLGVPPQGSVLGLSLFLMYINEVHQINWTIITHNDQITLHADLDVLAKWEDECGMSFTRTNVYCAYQIA